MNNAQFIIQISRGLIRDRRARRIFMFYNTLGVLVLVFAGATLLWTWLREHPLFFIGYWGLCAWLTVLAVLLALYDMARVRLDARRACQELEEEYRTNEAPGPPHDSPSP